VSRALRLDDVEHEHFFRLAYALRPGGPRLVKSRRPSTEGQEVILKRVLCAIEVPALIQNTRLDIVDANRMGWELYPHAKQYAAQNAGELFNLLRLQLLRA